MTYPFLLPALLFITPLHAQKIEVGINGGMVYNSLHNTVHHTVPFLTIKDFTSYQSSMITPVVSVKVMYVSRYYLLGVDAGYRSFRYKAFVHPDLPIFVPAKYTLPEQHRNRDVSLKVFVCRKGRLKHAEVYGGIFAAYIYNSTTSGNGNDVPAFSYSNRFGGGVLAGGTYYITQRIGVNAEVCGEWNNYTAGPMDRNIISLPVTLGIRYRM